MPLTDTAIKNTRPQEKPINMFDGGGLYLIVTPRGGKWWRLKYYYQKKAKLISLGTYPAVSLKEARKRRDEAKTLLASGIDPGEQRKQAKAAALATDKAHEDLFESVAKEWFASYSLSLSPKHAAKLGGYLQSVLFPALGQLPVAEIEPKAILAIIRPYDEKGLSSTSHKLLTLCNQVLGHAHITGRIKYNPASGLSRALRPRRKKPMAAITRPSEIAHLLKDIDSLTDSGGYPPIVYYLKILPYVFTRPSELRLAMWAEFDFDNALWCIPATRMKMRKEHLVPLSRQVIELLEGLRAFSGNGVYLFPSIRANSATVSDAGPLATLRRLGYEKNKMSLHGFRALASTRLNEMGFRPDVIEACLAHKDPDSVRLAYNRAQYMDERRQLMQQWADYLDGLRLETDSQYLQNSKDVKNEL